MNIPSQGIAVVMAIVALAAPVHARQAQRVTLEEALVLFARNNLELRLARAEAAEATGLANQSAAHANPTLIASHEPLSNRDVTYSESYFNLSQRLEWPATRAARKQAGGHTAASAHARVAADSARLAFQVKRAYVEAAHATSQVEHLARVTRVFRDAEESGAERFGEGDIARYELLRIRVERARYEGALAQAELQAAASRRSLALQVSPESETTELEPAAPLVNAPPTIDEQRATTGSLAERPELLAAQAALEAARADAALARGERIPDVTATGGYKRQSDGLSGAYLGISLPVPIWDHRRGAVEAADARTAAAAARLALTRRHIENDVRSALDAYRSLLRRAQLFDELQSAEGGDLLAMAQVAYNEGEVELLDLLDAATAARAARVLEARLRADLWIGYFDLERALGGFGHAPNEQENGR
jgi:cobalt-zinc-cadmium efflux system outer membrane protein